MDSMKVGGKVFLLFIVAIAVAVAAAFVPSGMASIIVLIVGAAAVGGLSLMVVSSIKKGIDAFGTAEDAMAHLHEQQKALLSDVESLAKHYAKGETDVMLNERNYHGFFQHLAASINSLAGSSQDKNTTESAEKLRVELDTVTSQIKAATAALQNGNLDFHLKDSAHASDMNALIAAVAVPIKDIFSTVNSMSAGDFSKKMSGQYKGDFAAIKEAVNKTAKQTIDYVEEIAQVLRALANKNLDVSMNNEYVGAFSEVVDAINTIAENFNHTIGDMQQATDAINHDAAQVSSSSRLLASEADQQYTLAQELSSTLSKVSTQAQETANSATQVAGLSNKAMESAGVGQQDMNEMLEAIEGIRLSSENISQVIQVIDTIARQTNLLALNAAVEAARAGVHGKGFMVVAEEVRNLADKSKQAANQTTELIADSIEKVNQGTGTANHAAEALERIVGDVREINKIVSGIAEVATEQRSSIEQVANDTERIANVAQATADTVDGNVSIAEDLDNQAETLRRLADVFTLKNGVKRRAVVKPVDTKPIARPTPITSSKPARPAPPMPSPTITKPVVVEKPKPVVKPVVTNPATSAMKSKPVGTAKPISTAKPTSAKPTPTIKPAVAVKKSPEPVKLTAPAKQVAKPTPAPRPSAVALPPGGKPEKIVAPSGAHEYNRKDFGKY